MAYTESQRKYYQKNRELLCSKQREYYQKNRPAILARNKRYTETHRDEIRSYHARYRKEHPDNCARATARWLEDAHELTANGARHGMPWDYTDDVFVMTSTKSLIEIAYELGRTYSACACRRKNLRKAGWTP